MISNQISKKIISSVLAVTLAFGGVALPCAEKFTPVETVTASAKTTVSKKVGTVKIKTAKATKNTVKVTFSKLKNVTGYQVHITSNSKMKGGKIITISGKNKNTATIKNLAYGKKYYINIRGYVKTKGKTYFGKWSKVKNVTTPKKKYHLTQAELKNLSTNYANIVTSFGDVKAVVHACVYDLNQDNISELIVNEGNFEGDMKIHYYSYNPKSKKLFKIKGTTSGSHRSFLYNRKTKQFATSSNYGGVAELSKISFDGKKIKATSVSKVINTEQQWNSWNKVIKSYNSVKNTINIYDGQLY